MGVMDVSDLSNPSYRGYHEGRTAAIDHNLYVLDDFVYQANYRAGLNVLKIEDMSNAIFSEAGYFDIFPSSDSNSFNGAWSNYPYFPSGSIVVSGIEQGLFVLNFNGPTPTISPAPTDIASPTPTSMPTISAAPTVPAMPYEIESTLGGCLDTASSSVGTDLTLQTCDSSDGQKWLKTANGNLLSGLDNSKCIGVQGNSYSNGVAIEVQDCVSGSDQEWTFAADGTVKSVANPSYCWDSNGFNGVVYLWGCDGTSDQYWILNSLVPPPPPPPTVSPAPTATSTPYEIESTRTGGCLDASSTSVGTDLFLQTCDSSDNQKWLQTPNGNLISALDNSKCIGVEGNSYSSGTPIEIQDCVSGSTDQEWTYEADGTVKSVANPSYCWDENSIGSDVYLWTCDGSSDQYWIFNSLSSPSPSAVESSSPSSVPSEVPSPPSPCYDSTVKVNYLGSLVGCSNVAADPSVCSSVVDAQSFCPVTCNACATYGCDDFNLPFVVGGTTYTCANLAAQDQAIIDFYCANVDAYTTCRATCRNCI